MFSKRRFQPKVGTVPDASDLSRLQRLVAQQDPSSALITRVELKDEDAAVFTLSTPLLKQNDRVKLDLAKNLWKIWASIHSPEKPDASKIELVGPEGNRIAKSNIQGGSLIKLETK